MTVMYNFTLSKTLTVGSDQDFILRFNPPIAMRATRVMADVPANIITVSECFMAGQDMRRLLKIHGFGIDAATLSDVEFAGPFLSPSMGVSFKCWYNGDEPEGYRTGEMLLMRLDISGPRADSLK